jgi:hypothetical protein
MLLLAAALFMRAVMPAGYMPERSADGTIAIALCNSEGVIHIPLKGAGEEEDAEHRSAPPCAFSGLGDPVNTPPDLPQIAIYEAYEPGFAAVSQRLYLTGNSRVLPPARGPPVPA